MDSNPSVTATTVIPGRLWQPPVGASWQIVLSQSIVASDVPTITPDVDVYDVDLFDTPPETIAALHARGKHVVCSYEAWRTDAARFDNGDLGSALKGWQGENWVKTGSPTVRAVMTSRIQLAASKGCDAHRPGKRRRLNCVEFLASTAAGYKMSIGLKNAGDIIPSVLSSVGFSVNEHSELNAACNSSGTKGFSTVIKKMSLDKWVQYCNDQKAN
ncbi:uncharacterized protein LOC62_08G009841 [Vanrija pseudolonga]|uniref:alpha-galactosidase n=1 Tax=Vanrija pseudolonga TaxID=143232 RepID=A0AAF0YH68_9TREE|nr:hypothetical protein LOC62_08G009841 [Vanrija pseudolonga]